MSRKLLACSLAIVLLAAFALSGRPKQVPEPPPAQDGFSLSLRGTGLVDSDSGKAMRAYADLDTMTEGSPNTTIELIALTSAPHTEVLYVSDYPMSDPKESMLEDISKAVRNVGMKIEPIDLSSAMKQNDSVILIPSDALPDALAEGDISRLAGSNTVIFYGKPLTIAEDGSGSEIQVGDGALSLLNLSDHDGAIFAGPGGPETRTIGNASVYGYPSGRLILYPESAGADEIAGMIMEESWHSRSTAIAYTNGTRIFSDQLPRGRYFVRLIYWSDGNGLSSTGMEDSVPSCFSSVCGGGVLGINDSILASGGFDYSYELWGSLEYPETYEFGLRFAGENFSSEVPVAPAVMKTYANENGRAAADLPPGSYLVELVDQYGGIHAAAYTHVPGMRIRLARIEEFVNVFNITIDGAPLSGKRITIVADGLRNYTVTTDGNGLARLTLSLGPGMHSFAAEGGGLSATTYYTQPEDGAGLALYFFFALFACFLALALCLRGRARRRIVIRSLPLRPMPSRMIGIPYDAFRALFRKIQEDRAPGLPLSVKDIRIGIMKHAVYKGRPLSLTDSNVYRVIDSLARRGAVLFHKGYAMPADAAGGLPMEHWVMRRRMSDALMERGERAVEKGGALLHSGKRLHVWPDIRGDPAGGTLIFPDKAGKYAYIESLRGYGAREARLRLELAFGKMQCVTIDEWLERV